MKKLSYSAEAAMLLARRRITICLAATMILIISSVANAHWAEGDPNKMHYPQLPDPYGWDVSFTNTVLADDWQCSESGAVKDIHLWFSIKGWSEQYLPEIEAPTIYVNIYSNIPAGEGGIAYSRPGQSVWDITFTGDKQEAEYAGSGLQGWLDPSTGLVLPADHLSYFQLNIDSIVDPFYQEEGTIYWLGIQATPPAGANYEVGWKTSGSQHFMDDAVWYSPVAGPLPLVYPEIDPRHPGSIDLAFVITPEPATIAMLSLGGLLLGRKRRV